MLPHTPAFNYYYTAPLDSVTHPPHINMPPPHINMPPPHINMPPPHINMPPPHINMPPPHINMPPKPNTYNPATGAPEPIVASPVPPVGTVEGPQGGINLNLLMAVQLFTMSQMNMRTFQSIFPVSDTPVSPASLTNNAVPGSPAPINDNNHYPKIDEFLESL